MRFCQRCFDRNYLIECACGCGRIITLVDYKSRTRKFLPGHQSKITTLKGEKSPYWRGGKYINSWGYVLQMCKEHPRADSKGYVFEHILVFEKAYNCCVLVWGNIHHIDHNKKNNLPRNLEGMTASQHTLWHNAHRVYNKWSEESKLKIKNRPRDWHGRLLSYNL